MIGNVNIMRCGVHLSPSMSAPKTSLQLFGASIVRIVSPHRFRLSETISETPAFSFDLQQLMSKIINAVCSNKKVFLREFINIIPDKAQSTITMRILSLECQRASS